MISARGAMPMGLILSEVALTKARYCAHPTLTLTDLERSWTAMSHVLRSHLMLGHSVAVTGRTCAFQIDRKVVAHDGRTRYSLRVPSFVLHAAYITTYGMDNTVPREASTAENKRLPLDAIAAEAKLPADVVSAALREVFLFVGEAVFQGRLMMLEFPGVATVLVKKDRVMATFAQSFLDELFAIDTRKWPAAMREAGQRVRPTQPRPESGRPSSSASSRPRSASASRPSTGAPAKHNHVFVPGAPSGRLFADITAEAERAKNRKAQGNKHTDPQPTADSQPRNAGLMGTMAPVPAELNEDDLASPQHFGANDDGVEESIYSIVTPARMRDLDISPRRQAASEAVTADEEPAPPQPEPVDVFDVEESVPEAPATQAPPQPTRRPGSSSASFFGFSGEEVPPSRAGRRRIQAPGEGYGVKQLIEQQALARRVGERPALFDNMQ